jgi:hypothetical protein
MTTTLQLDDIPETAEERVQACIRIGPTQWAAAGRGKMAKRLAAEWGCSLDTVQQASNEAWRRIKAQDAGWVREHLCADLEQALQDAKNIDDLRDQIRARVEVARTWAPIVGANAPTRAELTVRAAPPGVAQEQWDALANGDEVALARVNAVGLEEALPTFDALPAEERAVLRRKLMAWCEREGGE